MEILSVGFSMYLIMYLYKPNLCHQNSGFLKVLQMLSISHEMLCARFTPALMF